MATTNLTGTAAMKATDTSSFKEDLIIFHSSNVLIVNVYLHADATDSLFFYTSRFNFTFYFYCRLH